MPSVVATEKCAMSDGVNANSVSATLAAPSEKRRRVANHNATPRARPSKVFMGRVRHASHSGPGARRVTRKLRSLNSTWASIAVHATGSVSQRRPSGG